MVKVYVGGTYGETPTVVSHSIEEAMRRTAADYKLGPEEERTYDEEWMCEFVDGDPDILRCTMTMTDQCSGKSYALYVERYDINE